LPYTQSHLAPQILLRDYKYHFKIILVAISFLTIAATAPALWPSFDAAIILNSSFIAPD